MMDINGNGSTGQVDTNRVARHADKLTALSLSGIIADHVPDATDPLVPLATPDPYDEAESGVTGADEPDWIGNLRNPAVNTKSQDAGQDEPDIPASGGVSRQCSRKTDTRSTATSESLTGEDQGDAVPGLPSLVNYLLKEKMEQAEDCLNRGHDGSWAYGVKRRQLAELYHHGATEYPISVYQDLAGSRDQFDIGNKLHQRCCTSGCGKAKAKKTQHVQHIRKYICHIMGNSLLKDLLTDETVEEYENEALFVWAIVFAQRTLVLQLLRLAREPIASALVGCCLAKAICVVAQTEFESALEMDMKELATDLEQIAVRLIDLAYRMRSSMSIDLVIRKSDTWKNLTLLSIADIGGCMEFMSTTTCQSRLAQIWKGYFIANYDLTIALFVFIPVLMPFMAYKSIEESNYRNKTLFNNDSDNYDNLDQIDFLPGEGYTGSNMDHMLPSFAIQTQCSAQSSRIGSAVYCKGCVGRDDQRKRRADPWYPTFKNGCHRGADDTRWSCCRLTPLAFFYSTPIVKFYLHTVSYLVYLLLFSYFVCTNLAPLSVQPISYSEYIVWGWSLANLIEEIRQALGKRVDYTHNRIESYMANGWNRLDICIHILMVTSVTSHLTLPPEWFHWTRMCYATTLCLSIIRTINVFYAFRHIGPLVIMIRDMLLDMSRFILLMIVFMTAYAVSVQALKFPNEAPTLELILKLFYEPYWNLFGEMFENDGEILAGNSPDNCTHNETLHRLHPEANPRCSEYSFLAIVFLAVYLLVTNILLLNLLIAMFSNTFAKVEKDSEMVWKYHFHQLVREYSEKPSLVPPLNIISLIYRSIVRLVQGNKERTSPFYKTFCECKCQRLNDFEKEIVEIDHGKNSWDHSEGEQTCKIGESLDTRLESIETSLTEIKNLLNKSHTT